MYEYDDMEHGGYAQGMKNGKFATHLAGKGVDAGYVPGFSTNFVVYHLAGGTAAQERFLAHQIRLLRNTHHINISESTLQSLSASRLTFTKPNTSPVQPSERVWHRTPDRADVADYKDNEDYRPATPPAQHPRRRKRKRTKQHTHSPEKPVDIITISSSKSTTSVSEAPELSSTNGSAIASSPVDPVFPFPYPSTQHIPKQTTPTPDIIFPLTDSRSRKHALARINQQDNGSQISEPRSESFLFKLSCRCGQSGDATKIDSHLAKVLCIFCNQWSHVACQTDGRADPSTLIEDFICDSCQGPRYVMTVSISLITSY